MSKRIKLTAGGAKYVAEWKRYNCPNCKRNFYIHPTRWLPHLQECTKSLSDTEKSILCQEVNDPETKSHLATLLLVNSEVVH